MKHDIYGLDIVVADPCRCGSPLIRVCTHSTKSKIPIWRYVWCRKRRGHPTATEIALMESWLRNYGHTLEPLAAESDSRTRFLDEVEALWPGATRIARLIDRHDEWLKKKRSDGVSWLDIITQTLDENYQHETDDDEIAWD
jgi:hypothetical protein